MDQRRHRHADRTYVVTIEHLRQQAKERDANLQRPETLGLQLRFRAAGLRFHHDVHPPIERPVGPAFCGPDGFWVRQCSVESGVVRGGCEVAMPPGVRPTGRVAWYTSADHWPAGRDGLHGAHRREALAFGAYDSTIGLNKARHGDGHRAGTMKGVRPIAGRYIA